ncbi:MAG: MFS transporter [Ignavibacteriaceae bacterium]|nr:MFS transporter [Ignavibacteriaceae bacterium]
MKDISWRRNLIFLCIGQFLAMGGMSCVVPFLPVYIRDLGVSGFDEIAKFSGLVYAAPFLTAFFMQPVWGNLGDRYGRKIMTVRATGGLGIAQLLIAFSPNVYILIMLRLFQGMLSGYNSAAMTLIATNTPSEKQGSAIGYLQSSSNAGIIIGPLIGGVLANYFGIRNVFLIIGVLMFLISVMIWFFVDEEFVKGNTEENHSAMENWGFVLKSNILMVPSVIILLSSFGLSLIRPVFILFVEKFLSAKGDLVMATGMLYSIMGLFSTFSAALLAKKVDSEKGTGILSAGFIVTGLMYIAHLLVHDVLLMVPIRMMLGFAYGIILPAMFTNISRNTTAERKGGVLGIGTSFQTLGTILGSVLSGGMVSMMGFEIPFILVGVLFMLLVIPGKKLVYPGKKQLS